MFKSVKELVEICETENKKIHEVMLEQEMSITGLTADEVYANMDKNLQTMENALDEGLEGVTSTTGLTGGDAVLIKNYIASGQSLAGNT
ncbi:L-serine ammonia-lyase, iron-sulfur-dependent, subunit alpha, partial [Staphylococcus arlettae]